MSQYTSGSRRSSRRASVINPFDDGEPSKARENCNRIVRATLIVLCLVVTFVALIMIGIGIFAPSWWTLDVTEYSQEWQFGLWLYCRRGGMPNEVGRQGIDLRQWICDVRRNYAVSSNLPGSFGTGAGYLGSGSYQSAYYDQNSFAETDHNEIPVLACLSICFIFTFVSLFALCCAYCNKFVPYCILVSNLIAMITSVVAVLIYFVTMQDVTARRFTSYNSVYLLSFGYASYCVIAGAILLIINFIVSIPLVIFTFAWHREPRGHRVQTFNEPMAATYTSGGTPTANKPVYIGTYNQAVASEQKHGDMPIERWQYEHTRQESRY